MKRHPGLHSVGPRSSQGAAACIGERRVPGGITRRRMLVAGAALPLIAVVAANARAQQKPVLIGWLNNGSRDADEHRLARLAKESIDALILLNSGWFVVERRRFAKLALDYRWPLAGPQRDFAEAGALMSYGVDRTALYRRSASYVDRILKGAKPADLPIEQGTAFELVINAKTAKALGLTIPSELLLRANHIVA